MNAAPCTDRTRTPLHSQVLCSLVNRTLMDARRVRGKTLELPGVLAARWPRGLHRHGAGLVSDNRTLLALTVSPAGAGIMQPTNVSGHTRLKRCDIFRTCNFRAR